MNLAEIVYAGPGAEIQGDLQLYVAAVKKIVNNQHCAVEVQDQAGTKLPAMIFNLTAVQVGSWYVARQRMEAGKGPVIRYQQRGNYPASLAIDGSAFSLMGGGAPAATAAPPPAQAAPPPPAAAQPPPPPAHRPGAPTDAMLLGALEGWVKRLDANVPNLHQDTMTAILQSLIVGVREGSVSLSGGQQAPAQRAAPPPPASDNPPVDEYTEDGELIPF